MSYYTVIQEFFMVIASQ